MKCPIDETKLVISERQGIEIDYCPDCRGVWLDRGELDKIIERSTGAGGPGPGPAREIERERRDHERGGRRKRESFLSDLFDF